MMSRVIWNFSKRVTVALLQRKRLIRWIAVEEAPGMLLTNSDSANNSPCPGMRFEPGHFETAWEHSCDRLFRPYRHKTKYCKSTLCYSFIMWLEGWLYSQIFLALEGANQWADTWASLKNFPSVNPTEYVFRRFLSSLWTIFSIVCLRVQ